jgi:vitamin B12 transporter
MHRVTGCVLQTGTPVMEHTVVSNQLLATTTLATILVAGASPAFAQSGPPDPDANPGEAFIIVTATRTPQPPQAVGASVTVLTTRQIEAAQSVDIADLLKTVPGIGINRNGGTGAVASVRIRGAEADQTVVLIDGVKLNDPSQPGGGFNFANLLVGDLDRIEVLRGPQSTLYGSQAIGGVVNLISRRAQAPVEGGVMAEAGELATTSARAYVRGRGERYHYGISAGRFDSDGISAAATGTETDSYENKALHARGGWTFNPVLAVDGQVWWSSGDVGIDGFPAPVFALADTQERSKTDDLIVNGAANLTLLDGRWRTRLSLNQTTTDRDSIDPTLSVPLTFVARGRNERAELQSVLDLTGRLQLVGGFELASETLRTAAPSSFDPDPIPARAKADTSAIYLQVQATLLPWLVTTLGVRHSDHDRFGGATNLRATAAASLNGGNTILRAAIADGFKAPTLFQLYSDFGNQLLEPEEAVSGEIGIEQRLLEGQLVGGLTLFQRQTTNQIDFIGCFGNTTPICIGRPFGTYDNVARTEARGAEASLDYRPMANLGFAITLTRLDARNTAEGSPNFDRRLARRAETTASITADWNPTDRLDLSATWAYVGDSFDNASNTARLAGYDLVTLRASYSLSDQVRLYGRIENATDEIYQTSRGYGAPPRQASVGIHASF